MGRRYAPERTRRAGAGAAAVTEADVLAAAGSGGPTTASTVGGEGGATRRFALDEDGETMTLTSARCTRRAAQRPARRARPAGRAVLRRTASRNGAAGAGRRRSRRGRRPRARRTSNRVVRFTCPVSPRRRPRRHPRAPRRESRRPRRHLSSVMWTTRFASRRHKILLLSRSVRADTRVPPPALGDVRTRRGAIRRRPRCTSTTRADWDFTTRAHTYLSAQKGFDFAPCRVGDDWPAPLPQGASTPKPVVVVATEEEGGELGEAGRVHPLVRKPIAVAPATAAASSQRRQRGQFRRSRPPCAQRITWP